jgi:hypothetical protein
VVEAVNTNAPRDCDFRINTSRPTIIAIVSAENSNRNNGFNVKGRHPVAGETTRENALRFRGSDGRGFEVVDVCEIDSSWESRCFVDEISVCEFWYSRGRWPCDGAPNNRNIAVDGILSVKL